MLLPWVMTLLMSVPQPALLTRAEQTGFAETSRYARTLELSRRMDSASDWIHTTSFGTSPEGRELILMVVSKEGAFTPEAARATGKPVVMIQAGIHAGEIAGKDAGFMLLREIAVTKEEAGLLDNAIILFLPIYNVDGHERFGAFNRINQNGPAEMGWRVTASNLNLNRDFMKADAPETRDWLRLYTSWWPDLTLDCHTTDGADYQYEMAWIYEAGPNTPLPIASWMTEAVEEHVLPSVRDAGHRVTPYAWFADGTEPVAGVVNFGVWRPMYAHGYTVLQNRPSIVLEAHAKKAYETRVKVTLSTLRAFLQEVNRSSSSLSAAVRKAEESATTGIEVPLLFSSRQTPREVILEGVTYRREESNISGSTRIIYDGEPMEWKVNWPVGADVTLAVKPPEAYIVPAAWTEVIEVLRAHGIRMQRLTEPRVIGVSEFRLSSPDWADAPFEGRHRVTFTADLNQNQKREFPAGSMVVPTAQPGSAVIVQLLDPRGEDSFASWGFFNAIFEQKEGASPHVMEQIAREMLAADPSLKAAFERALKDPEFAASPARRLDWFYQRSPWWDDRLGLYPVGLAGETSDLPLAPLE